MKPGRGPPSRGNVWGSPPVRGCGLKLFQVLISGEDRMVTPRAGVWIETLLKPRIGYRCMRSPPVRGCGLKQQAVQMEHECAGGHPPCGGVD